MLWGEAEYTGYAIDLSAQGVFVETSDTIPAGTSLRLAFVVGSDRTLVDVEGRVVRSVGLDEAHGLGQPPGLGIEFDHFRTGRNALLQELTRRLGRLEEVAQDNAAERRSRRGSVPLLWGVRPPPANRGQLIHLSSSGAFIATNEPPPPTTHVYLQFDSRASAGTEALKAVGRVVRVNFSLSSDSDEPIGMSIVFESGSEVEDLLLFLEQQLARPAPEARLPTGHKPFEPHGAATQPPTAAPASDPGQPPQEPVVPEFEDKQDDEWDQRFAASATPTDAKSGIMRGTTDEYILRKAARAKQRAAATPAPTPSRPSPRTPPPSPRSEWDRNALLMTVLKFFLLPLLAFLLARLLL
jgi:hypothetical protein